MNITYDALYFPNFVHNVLNTVPGRDKVLKIIQYTYSYLAWRKGFRGVDFAILQDAEYSHEEHNAMSIQNTRRLFKIARFIGEWERIQTALLRSSELLYYPEQSMVSVLFIQIQMVLDVFARLLSCLKSVLDDILYFSRIGVLNPGIHRPLEKICPRIGIPVILIDSLLTSLKLIQLVENASSGSPVRHRKSFSLLARYEINEKRKIRRNMLPLVLYATKPASSNWVSHNQTHGYPLLSFEKCLSPMKLHTRYHAGCDSISTAFCASRSRGSLTLFLRLVWSKMRRLAIISYYNKEILWCWLILLKYSIDLTVALSYSFHLKCVHRGHVTLFGIVSGILGVCRIGNAIS